MFSGHINIHGLINAKAIIEEEQQGYYLTYTLGGDKMVHAFPNGISLKVNITWLEFDLAPYNVAVHHINHSFTESAPYFTEEGRKALLLRKIVLVRM